MEVRSEVWKLMGRKDVLHEGVCKQNDCVCLISIANWSESCLNFKDSLFFVETYSGEMLIFFSLLYTPAKT